MDYGEPPKTKREREREEARQKRQADKRHKKERKEIERKALESVMSLGYSKEEAKEKTNEICNVLAKQFRKAIKEENESQVDIAQEEDITEKHEFRVNN